MEHYSTKKRSCPHQIQIRAADLFRQTHDVEYGMRKHHVSRASVYRWNKQYDGTREFIENKSHKPKKQHPQRHTEREL